MRSKGASFELEKEFELKDILMKHIGGKKLYLLVLDLKKEVESLYTCQVYRRKLIFERAEKNFF